MTQYIIIGLLGLLIGSFLNVCIHRIPDKKSIVYPSSRCIYCGQILGVLDLIPVISYLILIGKCRHCKSKISLQYPLVELANGGLYILIYHFFGFSIATMTYFVLFSILLTITIIDAKTMRIPNVIIIFGLTMGLIYRIVSAIYYQDITIIAKGIIGMFTGVAIIGGIMLFSFLVFKKEGMGMGDLKLLGMIGLFVGSVYTLYAILFAVLLGGFYAVVILFKKDEELFPFGPFLAAGTLIALLWGDPLWNIYMNYML